jgi:hypothetical protein
VSPRRYDICRCEDTSRAFTSAAFTSTVFNVNYLKHATTKNTITWLEKMLMIGSATVIILAGCKSMNKTQKGAIIGTAGGAVVVDWLIC